MIFSYAREKGALKFNDDDDDDDDANSAFVRSWIFVGI